MRPSAAQLLQHERLQLFNVAETGKMLSVVKERKFLSREQALVEKEQPKPQEDQEIASLHRVVGQLQQSHLVSRQELEISVKQAVIREEELGVLIRKREEEIALAMAQREEIMEAVLSREEQLSDARKERSQNQERSGGCFKSIGERIVVNREMTLW